MSTQPPVSRGEATEALAHALRATHIVPDPDRLAQLVMRELSRMGYSVLGLGIEARDDAHERLADAILALLPAQEPAPPDVDVLARALRDAWGPPDDGPQGWKEYAARVARLLAERRTAATDEPEAQPPTGEPKHGYLGMMGGRCERIRCDRPISDPIHDVHGDSP